MIRLTVVNGHLAIGERMLIYHYAGGDVDTLPWPTESPFRSEGELEEQLHEALLDAVETGELPKDTVSVELPDGTEFDL